MVHPIGSVYISNTNTNPSSMFGGTWELINKGFIEKYQNDTTGNYFTINTSNVSSYQVALTRNDNTIRIRFNCTLNVDVEDSAVVLGNLNFEEIGISRITSGFNAMVGGNDIGNCLFIYQVDYDTGQISITDVIGKTENKIPSGTSIYMDFTFVSYADHMQDEACDKFYWKRTA